MWCLQSSLTIFAVCMPIYANEKNDDGNSVEGVVKLAPSLKLKDACFIIESILADLKEKKDTYQIFSANKAGPAEGNDAFLVWDIRLFNSQGDMMLVIIASQGASVSYRPKGKNDTEFRYVIDKAKNIKRSVMYKN